MKKIIVLVMSVGLIACAHKIPLEATEFTVPEQWQYAEAAAWPTLDWWSEFHSQELLALQQTAKESNTDLAAMAARLLQADYQLKISGASKVPTADASLGFGHSARFSGGGDSQAYSAGFSASYELDVWGRLYAQRQAARSSWLATQFEREAVALSVSAEIGRGYIELLAIKEKVRIAEGQLESAEQVLEIVKARVGAGAISPIDQMRQEAQLARQKAALHPLRQQRQQAELELAALLGINVDKLTVSGQFVELTTPNTQVGLSSELLLRRPDLRQQEARLEAAAADVQVARRAMYPAFRLTARTQQAGDTWSELWRGSWVYNVGASLTQPIFQGGRLRAEYQLSQAQEVELLENYRGALLTAFTEVEVALSRLDTLAQQYQAQQRVLEISQELFRLAERRYREGADDLLSLLEAQQSLYGAEEALLSLAEQQLQGHVTLYRVLGGVGSPI